MEASINTPSDSQEPPKETPTNVYLVHNSQRYGSTMTTLSTVSTITAVSVEGNGNKQASTTEAI